MNCFHMFALSLSSRITINLYIYILKEDRNEFAGKRLVPLGIYCDCLWRHWSAYRYHMPLSRDRCVCQQGRKEKKKVIEVESKKRRSEKVRREYKIIFGKAKIHLRSF